MKRITKVIQEGIFPRTSPSKPTMRIRGLADSYNQFAVKIRNILGNSKQMGLSIAVDDPDRQTHHRWPGTHSGRGQFERTTRTSQASP